jgi:type I restriction enzyme M protein
MSGMLGIEHLEKDLWEAADQLRANSKLASSEYVMPVMGIIFLRQANNRFETVHEKLTSDFRERKMPFEPQRADYINAGSVWLPEIMVL